MKLRPKLNGDDVREIFEAILPDEALERLIAEARFQTRRRKLDATRLVRAAVVAAATGYGGRQADVMRLYFHNANEELRMVRGGFYAWFTSNLEAVLEGVAKRALKVARSQPVDLPSLLARYARDWHIVDSSTIKLDKTLFDEYPGTGDYAALKVHKRFSVGVGTTVGYHLSPAREHDAMHLTIDDSWRGFGFLGDLGYVSCKLISDCDAHGVPFVIRLKDNWKPKVDRITRGEIKGTFFPGTDLDVLLDNETLRLRGRVIDAKVHIGPVGRAVSCRLVGVPTPGGDYRFYLTNLPAAVGPRQIADIYRIRWEIESDNKLDKSCNHIDRIQARTGAAVRTLVHASLTSSMLACLVSHKYRLKEGSRARPTERTHPPIHPQSLARAMGFSAQKIAGAFELSGAQATSEWQSIADYLLHLGQDSNWRRAPSILDQMRGWKTTPGRPRRDRLASPTTRSTSPTVELAN